MPVKISPNVAPSSASIAGNYKVPCNRLADRVNDEPLSALKLMQKADRHERTGFSLHNIPSMQRRYGTGIDIRLPAQRARVTRVKGERYTKAIRSIDWPQ